MKPSEILTVSLKQSSCNSNIVSSADQYMYLNFVITDFWKALTERQTDYWINTRYINAVGGTNEYNLTTPVANTTLLTSTFWVLNVYQAWIKYNSTQTDYTPLKVIKRASFSSQDEEYYETNQSTNSPVAILFDDNKIKVFPTPSESITNWIKIVWPKRHFPLSTTTEDVEWCLLIPSDRHFALIPWLKYWFYGVMWIDFVQFKNEAKQEYERNKNDILASIQEREQEPLESSLPNLDMYK